MRLNPSIDRLNELLHCDAETGVLTWKQSRGRVASGQKAGCIHKSLGYVCLSIDGRAQFAHRVVWAMVHGKWPDNFIDHINGVRSDNNPSNLRDVTQQVNTQNRSKASSHNLSGYLGVSFIKRTGRFASAITASDGRVLNLGTYATAEDAHRAYMDAKLLHHEGTGAQFFNRKAKTTCLEEIQAGRLAA